MTLLSRSLAARISLAAALPALLGLAASAGEPARDAASAAGAGCNFVTYHHDEAKNAGGAGRCTNDCDCDGMRGCASGACQGPTCGVRPGQLQQQGVSRERGLEHRGPRHVRG